MCYELEQYWVQRAEEAQREARRREEQRARQESQPKQAGDGKRVAPDGVKDPEPVPV
jgi:hypothetical protein